MKQKITKIIFTMRLSDVHACIEGHPEIWSCGKNSSEALGNLIQGHPESFPYFDFTYN